MMATPELNKTVEDEIKTDTKIKGGDVGTLSKVSIGGSKSIYRFTDKRSQMQRIETDRLLTNH